MTKHRKLGSFKQQKFILSHLTRPRVWNLEAVKQKLSFPFSTSSNCQKSLTSLASLACGPISLLSSLSPRYLLHFFFFFLQIYFVGLSQGHLSLDLKPNQDDLFILQSLIISVKTFPNKAKFTGFSDSAWLYLLGNHCSNHYTDLENLWRRPR